ncbi:MAG: serine hydrolase [Clostridia bacterium]|nr:serine hydrolase [Clostridia bacterium]
MCKRFFCILFAAAMLLAAVPSFAANAALFEKPDIDLSSDHVLLVNLNTGIEVFGVNPDDTVFPASTTKILTAILTIEACPDLDEKVEVTRSALNHIDIYSSQAGLLAGERLSVRDLLGLLMVKSACDAACVLAERVSGSEEAFADLMNAKAAELGCTGTHFVNSSGIHNENHYTTARDVSLITRYALQNPAFLEFFSMKQVATEATEKSGKRFFSTTNYLIDANRGGKYYYKFATGGKTGTTTPAGRCLVSTAKKGEAEYLCLVFGASGDSKGNNYAFDDTIALYKWCFDNLSVVKIGSSEGAQFETKLRYAWNHDYVTLAVAEDVYAVMPNGADATVNRDNAEGTATGLLVSVDIPDHLDAPVAKGDPAGTAKFFYRDEDGTVDLATGSVVVYESVDRNFFSFIFTNIGAFFSSTPVLIIFFVLLAALIGFVIYMLIRRSRSNRHRTTFRRRRSAKTNYRRSFRR